MVHEGDSNNSEKVAVVKSTISTKIARMKNANVIVADEICKNTFKEAEKSIIGIVENSGNEILLQGNKELDRKKACKDYIFMIKLKRNYLIN